VQLRGSAPAGDIVPFASVILVAVNIATGTACSGSLSFHRDNRARGISQCTGTHHSAGAASAQVFLLPYPNINSTHISKNQCRLTMQPPFKRVICVSGQAQPTRSNSAATACISGATALRLTQTATFVPNPSMPPQLHVPCACSQLVTVRR
jgi:hypothetical protein